MDEFVDSLRREFAAAGREREFVGVTKTLGKARMSRLDLYGTFVLTPDFPEHGSFEFLWGWLYRLGAHVVSALPLQLDPVTIALLYEGRATHAESYAGSRESWHPNRTRALTGVSLLVIVRASECGVQQRICASKGLSVHRLHDPNSLRGSSARCDRYFSLLHSADNLENIIFECALLTGDLEFLVRSVDVHEPLPMDVLPLLFGLGTIAHTAPGPNEPLLGAIHLALARLRADARSAADPRAVDALRELLQTTPRSGLRAIAEKAGAWAAMEAASLNTRVSSTTKLDALSRAKLSLAVQLLARPDTLDQPATAVVERCFAEAGIPLERWTAHRLHLYATFHSKRARRRETGI